MTTELIAFLTTALTSQQIDTLALDARDGNDDNFIRLYALVRDVIPATVKTFPHVSPLDIEEACHDALLKSVRTYDVTRGTFASWYRRNVYTAALDRTRVAQRTNALTNRYISDIIRFREMAEYPISDTQFTLALQSLPDALRHACILLLEGYSLAQVAKIVGYGDLRTLRKALQRELRLAMAL